MKTITANGSEYRRTNKKWCGFTVYERYLCDIFMGYCYKGKAAQLIIKGKNKGKERYFTCFKPIPRVREKINDIWHFETWEEQYSSFA